jgi:predicted Zn-dependent peptidase
MSERISTTVLPDGVTVVTEEMEGVRSVTLGIWVDVGSRDEVATFEGASHFLEHLAFKGSESLTARQIAEQVDAMGGDMNAFTTKEYTAFHLRSLDEDAEEGLGLLCEIVSAPAFRADEVASEQRVILEEIAMRADEPDELCHELLYGARFPHHPLGREIAGTAESVSAMTPEMIAQFHRTNYGPDTTVVAAAGAIRHNDVVKLVSDELRLPSHHGRPDRTGPTATPIGVVTAEDDTEQVHVALALSGYRRGHADRYAWGVVDHVLGGGLSSRLFQEIRESRGLAYSVYSYRATFEDAGFTGISFGTAPEHLDEVLDLIAVELDRLQRGGILESEMARCKKSLRGGVAMAMEDTGSRMTRLGRGQLLMGEVLSLDEVLAQTEAVTLADCQRVIDHVLAGPRSISVVGPVTFGGHSLVS